MAVNLAQELEDRYGTQFLVELTNESPGASAIETTRLGKAIADAQTAFERVTGRKFEFVNIDPDYLLWQASQIVQLTIWVLQAYEAYQTLEADTRYTGWKESVMQDRERNEVIGPVSNSTLTGVNPTPGPVEQFPTFNEDAADPYVPGNSDSGKSRGREGGIA